MHPRMKSLHTAAQDFWESGEFFYFDMWDRLLPKQFCRAARRNELNTHLGKATSKRRNSRLIRYRNESANDLHEGQEDNRFSFGVYGLPRQAHYPRSREEAEVKNIQNSLALY